MRTACTSGAQRSVRSAAEYPIDAQAQESVVKRSHAAKRKKNKTKIFIFYFYVQQCCTASSLKIKIKLYFYFILTSMQRIMLKIK
jgi:hypothetical protein